MIELIDTDSAQIAAEFVRARRRAGSPAMGMVMTLVIVVDEDVADAIVHAVELPPHVNVDLLTLKPVAQAAPHKLVRKPLAVREELTDRG